MLDFLFTLSVFVFLFWLGCFLIFHINIFNAKHRLMWKITKHLHSAMDIPTPLAFKHYNKSFKSLLTDEILTIEYDYDRRFSTIKIKLNNELIAIWDHDRPEYSSKKFHPVKFNSEIMIPYFQDVASKKGYVTWI